MESHKVMMSDLNYWQLIAQEKSDDCILARKNCTKVEKTSPRQVHYEELEAEIADYVCLKRKIGLTVTCKVVKYTIWELAETHITWHYFNASRG